MKNYLLLFWRKRSLLWLLGFSRNSPSLWAQSKQATPQPIASQTTTAQARVAATAAIAPDQPFSMILMSDTQLPWWRGAHDPDCKSDACVEQQAKRTNLNMLTSVNAIGNMGAWPTGSTRKNDIARLTQLPSGVIINGDLTAYFHPYQFDMYKEFWDAGRTTRPIYPGLGNHDYSNNTPPAPNCSVNCTGGTYGLYYPDYWRNAKEAVWYMANKITDGSIPNIVNRDLGGYVSLHNVAAFNARLTVAYLLNGQLVSRTSDGFESGQWKAFPVPRGATQVSMTIEKNNGIRWVTVGSSTNLPVTRNCFKVQGNDSFTSDDCRREWPTGSEGSLSYSFDINNYHFVQLHLEPSYEKDMIERPLSNLTVAAYNPGKSPGFKITKSIAWLKADLDNATAQGKRIVLNMHTNAVGYFGDSTQRAANETAFYDAIAYQNVVAVFSGHLHEQYGYEYASNNSGRNNNIQWFKTGSAECERFLYAEFHDSYFTIGVVKTEGGMPVFVTNPNDICSMTGANYSNPIDRTVRWLRTELVTGHPVSQTFCTGLAARFSARTTTDATRFQWQIDANTGRFEDIAATDTRFSGITSATLTITNVTNALAGFRFRIRVQNEAGTLSTSDAATLSIKPTLSTLSIVAQPPGSLAACTGGRTTVSVDVSGGSSENSYQWYRNNVAITNITSATTPALSLTNLQSANAGSYQVVVQVPNCPISVTSSAFSLSVTTTSPGIFGSFTATYSDIQNFTPTGSGNISVDPQLNTSIGAHVPVPCAPVVNTGNPATSTALVGAFDIRGLARVVGGRIDMGAYEASNPAGITQQPASGTVVCAGSTVTVSVVATGGTFRYQWYRNGIALTGIASATTATLTIPNVQTANVGAYSVVVTATCGSFTSTPFNLSLSTPIVMDSAPYSFLTCAGLAITLQGSVTGTVSSYQWYQNGTAIAGATSVTLGIPNAQPTNSGSYVLVATGVCNSVTSAVTNLTITPGAKIYVNASASGTNTGTSWANAYRSLQSALQYPLLFYCSATEIWVAKGVYKPTTTSDRTLSFSIRNGVAVYGGVAGTETAISQRNLAQNPTVLSGDIDNNDTNTDGNNVAESYTAIQGSNSYHVVTVTDNAQVRLDGLIITAGQSNGTSVHLQGGGLYTYSANGLLLANCRFQGNTSADSGGLYTFASNLTVVNSSFAGNQAGYGAAILHRNSTTNLINCSFGNNRATSSGGGLYTNTGSFSITNSIIWGNTAPTDPNISGSITATYSDIQSLTTGTGNIQSDPRFVDAATGNLALQANSPVINLGNPVTTTAQVGNTDLNSNPRFVNTRIDMGAYEFQGSSGPIFTVKAGNWNDSTVWSVGYVPGTGDAVELRHVITIPASYLATCLRMTFATGGRLTYGLASKLRLGF